MIIPSDFLSVKGKKGLYYKNHSFTVNGVTIVSRDLRADDQHCFYDNNKNILYKNIHQSIIGIPFPSL